MFDSEEFRKLILINLGATLSERQIQRIVEFREEALKENEIQNLTRLISPRDFYEGNVLDVVHLEKSGFLKFPALDLGAGAGVPGVLHAIIYEPKNGKTWISSDSESKKADFLVRMIERFSLVGSEASSMRGEDVLSSQLVETIVARAVGPVSRIYGWLRTRSTWNTLVLLKGPKWEQEWDEFETSPHQGRLVIEDQYEYDVGNDGKRLKIIRLKRK